MTDTIKKTAVLAAPLAKVWHAISDSQAFGAWFGMTIEGPFVEGQTARGAMAKTQVDPAIAEQQAPYAGMACDLMIERIVPQQLLSFRWHPGAAPDAGLDAPTTLVTFSLEAVPGGTKLTITESGFDALPLDKREKAFADNEGGWEAQLTLVAKYVAREA